MIFHGFFLPNGAMCALILQFNTPRSLVCCRCVLHITKKVFLADPHSQYSIALSGANCTKFSLMFRMKVRQFERHINLDELNMIDNR